METIAVIGGRGAGKTWTSLGLASAFQRRTRTQFVNATGEPDGHPAIVTVGAGSGFRTVDVQTPRGLRQLLDDGGELTVLDTSASIRHRELRSAALFASDLIVAVMNVRSRRSPGLDRLVAEAPNGADVIVALNGVTGLTDVQAGVEKVQTLGERAGRRIDVLHTPIRWVSPRQRFGRVGYPPPGTTHNEDSELIADEIAQRLAGL